MYLHTSSSLYDAWTWKVCFKLKNGCNKPIYERNIKLGWKSINIRIMHYKIIFPPKIFRILRGWKSQNWWKNTLVHPLFTLTFPFSTMYGYIIHIWSRFDNSTRCFGITRWINLIKSPLVHVCSTIHFHSSWNFRYAAFMDLEKPTMSNFRGGWHFL